MRRTEFNLEPTNSQKSFYGKAKVTHYSDGLTILKSYDTDVCYIDANGAFHRTWNGYSATTMKHVNSFLDVYSIAGGGKAWWSAQKIERAASRLTHDMACLETLKKEA